jgi:hypothetical protein
LSSRRGGAQIFPQRLNACAEEAIPRAAAAVITATFEEIDPQYPTVSKEREQEMRLARELLEKER